MISAHAAMHQGANVSTIPLPPMSRPGIPALRCAASLVEGSGGGILDISQGYSRLPLPRRRCRMAAGEKKKEDASFKEYVSFMLDKKKFRPDEKSECR